MKMSLIRFFLFLIFILMVMGFRVLTDFRWNISEADPYLWIRHCNTSKVLGQNDVNSGDDLYYNTTVTIEDVLNSIVTETNSIFGSYLRIELYPSDPNNPSIDSHFTIEKSTNRVIDICNEEPGGAAGGTASVIDDGHHITSCKIIYKLDAEDNVSTFLRLIMHEVGHCYGLAHPQEITDAIMSYYSSDDDYRYLIDDKNGIRHLYPATIEGVSHKEIPTYGLKCAFKK